MSWELKPETGLTTPVPGLDLRAKAPEPRAKAMVVRAKAPETGLLTPVLGFPNPETWSIWEQKPLYITGVLGLGFGA